MIDWVRCELPLVHHPLNAGEVISFDEAGEVEWSTPKRKMAVGSYDKRISVKSSGGDGQGMATHLWVSGNPAKFLQGHNVFGSDDLVSLVYDTFLLIAQQFNLSPTPNELSLIKHGHYDVSMIDINYSFSLPSRSEVHEFIRSMEQRATTRHGTLPTMKKSTLYFGQTSTRWSIKLYCKADEIQKADRAIPTALHGLGIEQWAENKLRVELRLHKKELIKHELQRANRINPDVAQHIFNKYLGTINMSERFKLTDTVLDKLPRNLRSTYTLWSEGHQLRNMMSIRTFYRQKKQLMQYGINIDLSPINDEKPSNVVPYFRILEAKPAAVPEFAYSQNLIHHSARRAV